MVSVMGAGFAFAIAGKALNYLWPSKHSMATRNEMERHNRAMEKFTAARNAWEQKIREKIKNTSMID